jgi:hypothetical protein
LISAPSSQKGKGVNPEFLGVKKGLPAGKNGMGIQSIRGNLLPKGLPYRY